MIAKHGVKAEPPADRPSGIHDFIIVDPTGVLWRIGQIIGYRDPLAKANTNARLIRARAARADIAASDQIRCPRRTLSASCVQRCPNHLRKIKLSLVSNNLL